MALVLEVQTEGIRRDVPISATQTTLVLGSGENSDVRIDHPSVAAVHARLVCEDGVWTLHDAVPNSATRVGGVRLRGPRTLRPGDRIDIGRVRLLFRDDATAPGANARTVEIAMRAANRALRMGGASSGFVVLVVEGPDRGRGIELADTGRAYVIGRDASCDLVLDDPDGSRKHVAITLEGEAVHIRDLESRHGTELGRERLAPNRDALWTPRVMARLGSNVLALEPPFRSRVDAAVDEVMRRIPEPVEEEPAAPEAPPPPEESAAAEAAPSSAPGSLADAAPVATAPAAEATPELPPRRRVRVTGGAIVVVAAVVIIVASLAALVWLIVGTT